MSYIDEQLLPFGFCPGCGHIKIAGYLDEALTRLALPPEKVVIVTDIGCIGILDKYYKVNAFHGLHGRVLTYASGIKLADPELTVIAVMGDGGAGIGGAHLLSAARRNIGVTLIVANNFNYGMTGGQHSCTTPREAVTATTPLGNLEAPLDLPETLRPSKPSFLARTTVFADDAVDLLVEALEAPGFALVDIWDICVAYFAGRNPLTRNTVDEWMDSMDMPAGVLYRGTRPEFSQALRDLHEPLCLAREAASETDGAVLREASEGSSESAVPPGDAVALEQVAPSALEGRMGVLIAGSAGQKIRSVATLLGAGGIMSGLFATQKDDYPITVRTGHSQSEVILSPERIYYTGTETPDVVLLLSGDGLAQVAKAARRWPAGTRVYADSSLAGIIDTRAEVVALPLEETARAVGRLSLGAVGLGVLLAAEGLFPPESYEAAARLLQKAKVAETNIAGLRAGMRLIGERGERGPSS